jgi:hypothetical protein
MATSDPDYDALADRLTDPDSEVRGVGKPLTGTAAADAGRAFLLREYGSEQALQRALRPGRPRVGSPGGESPTVRGRISDADFAAFKRLEESTGKNQSELVREAVQLLLAEHKIGA